MKNLQPTSAQTRLARASAPVFALLLSACGSPSSAEPDNGNRMPDVPDSLRVPEGNKVSFHAYAAGVQIYIATASTNSPTGFAWTFHAPDAVLYNTYSNVIGTHYAFSGPARPTWKSKDGSRVVGVRSVAPATMNSNAIPWLILRAVSSNTIGPGIFERTTYIQRINTTGGLAPTNAPMQSGQEARVPYTAEYFFYREQKQFQLGTPLGDAQ